MIRQLQITLRSIKITVERLPMRIAVFCKFLKLGVFLGSKPKSLCSNISITQKDVLIRECGGISSRVLITIRKNGSVIKQAKVSDFLNIWTIEHIGPWEPVKRILK